MSIIISITVKDENNSFNKLNQLKYISNLHLKNQKQYWTPEDGHRVLS